jgi:uncharacterized membrane protein (UPF0127 family)
MPNRETKKTESALKLKIALLVILLLLFFVMAAITTLLLLTKPNIKKVTIGNSIYELQVADTKEERERGLSGQKELKKNGGMILDFNTDGDWGIWMKNMNFNIDIAWLDQSGKVVGIQKNVSPNSYPDSYNASADSRYVIELPHGTLSKNNINTGNFVKID